MSGFIVYFMMMLIHMMHDVLEKVRAQHLWLITPGGVFQVLQYYRRRCGELVDSVILGQAILLGFEDATANFSISFDAEAAELCVDGEEKHAPEHDDAPMLTREMLLKLCVSLPNMLQACKRLRIFALIGS